MSEHECYHTLHEEHCVQATPGSPILQVSDTATTTEEDDEYELVDLGPETGDINLTGSREVSPENFLREINDLPQLRTVRIFRKAEQKLKLGKNDGEVMRTDGDHDLSAIAGAAATIEPNPPCTVHKPRTIHTDSVQPILHILEVETSTNPLNTYRDQTLCDSPRTDPDLRDEGSLAEDFKSVTSNLTDKAWILRRDMLYRLPDLADSYENESAKVPIAEEETDFFDAPSGTDVELAMPILLSKNVTRTEEDSRIKEGVVRRNEVAEAANLEDAGDMDTRMELYEIGLAATATAAMITLLWAMESAS